MSEITKTFLNLKTRNEAGLIAYITAGDPNPSYTPRIVEALIKGGADIIELGIPFSDPIADGPTIQAGSVRALDAGTTPKMVLEIVAQIKKNHKVPMVIMTYYNSIFKMGLNMFMEHAKASGVDGIIVPDLPIEEATDYKKYAEANQIDTIFLTTPSTHTDRLNEIVTASTGFLYLVSVFGVTGAREALQEHTLEMISKTVSITRGKIPLAVGFGISKPEHVKSVVQNGADAAIVGSGFVRIIENGQNDMESTITAIEEYTRKLKKATK